MSPFTGRENELALLRYAMAQAEAGHGQVVGIVGDAGVGKSRLLYEFHRHLDHRRATYLEGRCLSYGTAMPFLPVQDIVRAKCGITDADPPQEIGKRVRAALERVGMSPDDAAPYLLQLLGVKEGTEALAAIGPEAIKARIFSTLVQMSVAGSRRRPIIFAVEDLHWIDKTSEEYFTTAVEAMAAARIVLMTTYRPGYRPPWIDKSYATQIAVHPLAARDSRSVIDAVMQRAEATEALVQAIVGKAEGNPFFLEELTRVLLEQRSATVSTVPETIQGVLLARIDRLPERQKRVLQTAAVLGREFSGRLLRAVWDGEEDLEPDLTALTRQELLYTRGGAEDASYVFKHALTQDVAYESLLTRSRHALHEAAGRALEAIYPDRLEQYCELLSHHYSHSANVEKALDYLELANQKAARANAVEEARIYFDEAMKFLDMMPETEAYQRRRVALLVNQVLVMLLTAKFSEYNELLTQHEPMAVGLGDPGLLGAFYARLGYCEWVFGHLDEAIQTFAKAVDLCETSGRAEDAGQAYSQWEWTHLFRGDYDRVLALKERAVRVMERHFNLRWYAWALAAASWSYTFLGRWDQAVEEAQKGLRVAEKFSDNSAISFAAWTTSMAYAYKGELADALAYAELAVEKAPTPADKAWAESFRGWVWCRAGKPQKGVEILSALVPMYRAAGFVPGEIFALFLGEGYWLAGEYDKARQTLEEVLTMAERYGLKFHCGCAHRILGEIALKTNPAQLEAPLAAPHFAKSVAMLRAINATNELALAYAGYGRLHKRQGSVERARKSFTRALEVFERLGTLIEPDKIRQELAELASAHPRGFAKIALRASVNLP
jgi:tetratricopeptide (TPR) repeat protein